MNNSIVIKDKKTFYEIANRLAIKEKGSIYFYNNIRIKDKRLSRCTIFNIVQREKGLYITENINDPCNKQVLSKVIFKGNFSLKNDLRELIF